MEDRVVGGARVEIAFADEAVVKEAGGNLAVGFGTSDGAVEEEIGVVGKFVALSFHAVMKAVSIVL